MADLATSVGRLHYRAFGGGPGVLFWHNWLAEGRIFDAQLAALSVNHRVIAVDGPGHGRSEVVTRPFSLEDCADAVVEILDAEGLETAILVGSSWGGMTAMRVALRAPSRVSALALLGTSADAEPAYHVEACRLYAAAIRRFGMTTPLRCAALLTMFGVTTLASRPRVVAREFARLGEVPPSGVPWSTRALVEDRRPILGELHRITAPTLVAVGREDRCLPPFHSRRIAERIPGARLEIVPRAGHVLSLEAPHELTVLLEELSARASREGRGVPFTR